MRLSFLPIPLRYTMDTMTALANNLPHLHISLERKDYEKLTVTPWFSFRVAMPCQPLPSLEERPVLHTETHDTTHRVSRLGGFPCYQKLS